MSEAPEAVLKQRLQEVQGSGGTLNDLVATYTDADRSSEEFAAMKKLIAQRLTTLRSALRTMCKAQGIPEDSVYKILPKFKNNTQSQAKTELLDSFLTEIE